MVKNDNKRAKRLSIFYAGLIVAALVALAIGILQGNLAKDASSDSQFILVLPRPLYYTLTALVGASVLGNLIIIIILRRGMGGRRPDPKRRRGSMLFTLVLLAIFLLLMSRRDDQSSPESSEPDTVVEETESSFQEDPPPFQVGTRTVLDDPLFIWAVLLTGGMSALGIWTLFRAREVRSDSHRPRDAEEELLDEVEASLDDLNREPDPRKAVIDCYSRLEKVLRRHGLPRSPHLAPLEYMREGLLLFNLPETSTRGLTELFEISKFSLHPIRGADKTKAIVYLKEIKDHLESEQSHEPIR